MPPDDLFRQSERFTQFADLHFVKVGKRLNHQSLFDHSSNYRNTVVMGFDNVGSFRSACFDCVRINRPLSEEAFSQIQTIRNFTVYVDKGIANDAAFLFRIGLAFEGLKKAIRIIGKIQIPFESAFFKFLDHHCAFILAHHAVIDMQKVDALGAERFPEQKCANRAVHAARRKQKYRTACCLLADLFNQLADIIFHRPVRTTTANIDAKIPEHFFPVNGVIHFRMELKAIAAQMIVADRCIVMVDAARNGKSNFMKTRRANGDSITMAHPYGLFRLQSGKYRTALVQTQHGGTKLAFRMFNASAVVFRDFLVPVAKAENRDLQSVNLLVVRSGVFIVSGE